MPAITTESNERLQLIRHKLALMLKDLGVAAGGVADYYDAVCAELRNRKLFA